MGEEVTTSWHSYPKSYALGHRYIADVLKDDVIVEEKIDGSQFSFGIFGGEIRCRSKGAVLNLVAPEKMFIPAINTVRSLAERGLLVDGWTYRGEFLGRTKHNVLAYERIPAGHIIGFDINTGHETYMPYEEKAEEFKRLGLEVVPLLCRGRIENINHFREILKTISILGGQPVEGVVIKNYSRFLDDGKVMMAKFVSEAFKEIHSRNWAEANPGQGGIVERLIEQHKTPARWQKAVQRIKEAGIWKGAPEDIGHLIKAAREDVAAECKESISDALYQWAEPQILRGVTGGIAEWYKDELIKEAFNAENEDKNESEENVSAA